MNKTERLRELLESKKQDAKKPATPKPIKEKELSIDDEIKRLQERKAEVEGTIVESEDGEEDDEEVEDEEPSDEEEESEDEDTTDEIEEATKEEPKKEPKKIEINPLVDNGLFREEILLRFNLLLQEIHKIAEAVGKK